MGTAHILVHRLKVAYESHGDGRAILFIHGWAGSRLHWNDAPIFLKNYRIIALDLYGFGDSEEPFHVSTPESYVGQVCDFIKQLGTEDAVLVGHSVGGLIAANVALRISENVRALVLMEAPVGKELEAIKCPILLIFGDRHSLLEGLPRIEVANKQLSYNSKAELCFIEKAGHNPMLENASKFYTALNDFCETLLRNHNS